MNDAYERDYDFFIDRLAELVITYHAANKQQDQQMDDDSSKS